MGVILRRGGEHPAARAKSGMTLSDPGRAAAERLADALLQSYGQIALIVDHMALWRATYGPGPDAVPDILRRMLGDALTSLAPAMDLTAAAGAVDRAVDAIAEEVMLVPLPGPGCTEGRAHGSTIRRLPRR